MSIFDGYTEHVERTMRDISLRYENDPETCYQKMIECMCEALEEFGCYEAVQIFKETASIMPVKGEEKRAF